MNTSSNITLEMNYRDMTLSEVLKDFAMDFFDESKKIKFLNREHLFNNIKLFLNFLGVSLLIPFISIMLRLYILIEKHVTSISKVVQKSMKSRYHSGCISSISSVFIISDSFFKQAALKKALLK
jgi:hypothetical protein